MGTTKASRDKVWICFIPAWHQTVLQCPSGGGSCYSVFGVASPRSRFLLSVQSLPCSSQNLPRPVVLIQMYRNRTIFLLQYVALVDRILLTKILCKPEESHPPPPTPCMTHYTKDRIINLSWHSSICNKFARSFQFGTCNWYGVCATLSYI